LTRGVFVEGSPFGDGEHVGSERLTSANTPRETFGVWDGKWVAFALPGYGNAHSSSSPHANPELARTVPKIQHAAYALEATLIDDDRIPALHEDIDDLRSAPLLWLAPSVDGCVVGALGWSQSDEEIDIDRLIVAPDMHRRGVGSALVREVLQRAGNRRTVVSTGRDNIPAKAMYEQLGFARIEDEEIIPGLWVSRYRRTVR